MECRVFLTRLFRVGRWITNRNPKPPTSGSLMSFDYSISDPTNNIPKFLYRVFPYVLYNFRVSQWLDKIHVWLGYSQLLAYMLQEKNYTSLDNELLKLLHNPLNMHFRNGVRCLLYAEDCYFLPFALNQI